MLLHRMFLDLSEFGLHVQSAAMISTRRQEVLVKQIPPPLGFIKVIVDGASKGSLGHAVCAFVLRNSDGCWIFGAARNFGGAIGPSHSWDHGFHKVVLEKDSSIVHRFLTLDVQPNLEEDMLVKDCRRLPGFDWELVVQKIYREANGVADGIASWVLGREIGLHFLPYPPP